MIMRRAKIGAMLLLLCLVGSGASAQSLQCDGKTDDAPAFNQIFQNGMACTHRAFGFRDHGDCVMKEHIILPHPYCTTFNFQNAVLDFSTYADPSHPIAIQQVQGADPDYFNESDPISGLTIKGPGPNSGITGLQLNDNHLVLNNLTVHDFGTNVAFGNYAFAIDFYSIASYNSQYPIYCNGGVDAGEQIDFHGGALFNSSYGLWNRACEFRLFGTAIDATTTEPIWTAGSGVTYIDGAHIEDQHGFPGSFVEEGTINDCNAFTHVEVRHSRLITGPNSTIGAMITNNTAAPICGGSGPWVKFTDDILSGFNTTTAGNNQSQVVWSGLTLLNGGGAVDNVPNRGN